MTGASPARGGGRWPAWRPLLAAAVLAGAVVAIFHSTAGYPFSYYDDDRQILENPHVRSLGLENLYWIYTHFCITNYYPTRLLSYAIDYRLWAGSPGGFHLGNLLIHAGNVLLLFWLLVRLGRAQGRRVRAYGGRKRREAPPGSIPPLPRRAQGRRVRAYGGRKRRDQARRCRGISSPPPWRRRCWRSIRWSWSRWRGSPGARNC